MGELPEVPDIVRRCQATVIRVLLGLGADAEVGQLVADLSQLPADQPDRGPIAAGMLMAMFRDGAAVSRESAPHVEFLLSIADADPPPHPQWNRVRSVTRVQVLMHAGMAGRSVDLAAVEKELAPMAAELEKRPELRPLFESMRVAMHAMRAVEEGDESVVHRAPAEMKKHLEQLGNDAKHAPMMRSLDLVVRAMAANQRGEHAEMVRNFELLYESIRNLDPADPLRQAADEAADRMTPLYQVLGLSGTEGDGSIDPMAALEERVNRPDDTDNDRATNHLALGGALIGGGQEADLSRVEAGIDNFRQALRLFPTDHPQHTFAMHSLALGLYRRAELAGTVDGLDEAAELVEQACERFGGPHHRDWAHVNGLLATIRHRQGEVRAAGETGLVAQRGFVWRVLLESDATGAKIAIQHAADAAVDSARRCIQADDLVGALRALDTCRGLMLFAATEWHKVPARLAAEGRDDLARRWEVEGKGSSDLRREVLAVLARQLAAEDNVLDPPSLEEIRSALAMLEADALVYLVPAGPPLPGLAVIATVDGKLAWMPLPNLVIGDGGVDVERYLVALADRSRDLAAQHDGQFTGSLAALCDWAWRAAMGPVLDQLSALRPSPADAHIPRIVLIPMGDLARIPWQAARRHDGVHAVELAAFSQAVSARLLCENATRAPVTLSSTGLIVGDPDTGGAAHTLDDARLEAHAVRQAFYQGARYVGRRPNGTVSPSGRGTAEEIRRWLADTGPAAGVMLHLACHGSFATGLDDAKSTLLLASEPGGTDAGELSAEEIVDLLGVAPQRRVGLVVLAACNTGRSAHGYDEAYSLGTAFLAGSACSVLSTQWSIPDAQTPSLMYLFHHYCRREGLPPWQALRQAQVWMLDPKRQAPEGMPAELWLSVPAGEAAPVAAWAGFVHYGH